MSKTQSFPFRRLLTKTVVIERWTNNRITEWILSTIVQIPLNVLCIFHTSMLTYICTTFVFFVRITLVNLHSNQINCQGKARLKPSLPWAGIPCFSVYLLSRRGNSQVAAIPGSLKLIHNRNVKNNSE